MQHAFTVDVEDWYHGIPISAETKAVSERRLTQGLGTLLQLLEKHQVKATFFLLGPVALEHRSLVREIARGGHEIGCHGWSHDLLYEMGPARFEDETKRAKFAIEEVSGQPVVAYRAAYFSITKQSWWALESLAKLGFLYDSSIFPVKNWRYGIEGFSPKPQEIETPAGPILELPISVTPRLGRQLPVSGGAYFRLYPYALTRANFRKLEKERRPVNFYLHPWELDPGHPRLKFHWRAQLTHYGNLKATEPRLERLLSEFRFAPLGKVMANEFNGYCS